MWPRFTSQVVVSALLALSGILLVPGPRCAAVSRAGDDPQTTPPPAGQNENKQARAQGEKIRHEPEATRKDGAGPASKPNPKMAATDALMRTLDQEISTKSLPNSFYPLLDHLTDKMREVGKELTFFVDVRAFSRDVQAVIDGELPPPPLKLQPLPPRMSVRALLQMAVSQFDGDEATFLVRRGRVEITTRKAAALPNLLKQTFAASFDRQPLEVVLDDLSEITGVSVVLDGRAGDKGRTAVTARFRNDVPLLEALRMVTESAGLKLVELPGDPGPARALFVTTPEHAKLMRR